MKVHLIHMNAGESKCIYLRDDFLSRFPVTPSGLLLNIGARRSDVKVVSSNKLPANTIGLSQDLTDGFDLPGDLPYDVRIDGRHLHIGPVLAFLAFSKEKKMTPETLSQYGGYLSQYGTIGGLVYLCSNEGVNLRNQTVSGYYYNPSAKTKADTWKRGVFPYPGAVYARSLISSPVYKDFIKNIGDCIFNSFSDEHFDKWQFWKWLSPHSRIRRHLPHTETLTGLSKLDEMLSKHGEVYLKPTNEMMSRGILKVKKDSKGYRFMKPLKKKHEKAVSVTRMSTANEAAVFVQSLMKDKKYIIQQSIQMYRYEGRGIDFRVMLQKNGKKEWTCTGIVARFGKKNSIVTNFRAAGYAVDAEQALRQAFHYTTDEAASTMRHMVRICIEACGIMENKGKHYGDVGADMMIDDKGAVWLLEINILPDHNFPLYADNAELHRKVLEAPLLYAKALAGFEEGRNG